MIKNFFKNINTAFALFALAGLISAVILKLIFSDSDDSFYPTLGVFMALLFGFHYLCYKAIDDNKYKDLGGGRRMSDGAVVDAVYYLGFTFTLVILITTFVSLSNQPVAIQKLRFDNNLHELMQILNKFCVGLLTTGYGLVARIHLSNYVEIEDLDPEGLKERLNVKTVALINILDTGITSLSEVVSSANQKVVEAVNESTNSLVNQSNHLSSHLAELSENLSKVLTKVKRQVSNLDLTDATATVESHLNNTAVGILGLNKNIEDVAHKYNNAGKVIDDSSQKLSQILEQINNQHTTLLNNLNDLSKALTTSLTALQSFDGSAKLISPDLNSLRESLATSIANLTEMSSSLKNVNSSLSNFSIGFSESKTAVLSGSSEMNSTLSSNSKSIDASLKDLSEKVQALNAMLASVQKNISSRF
jgi:chromosome segregation ATPase